MKENETPETETETELQESEKGYNQEYNIKKVNKMVQEYVEEKGTSPFIDIDIDEENDGQLKVDIDKKFEEALQDEFGLFLQETLGDYFSFLIKTVVQDLEASELANTDKDTTEDTSAPKESEKN